MHNKYSSFLLALLYIITVIIYWVHLILKNQQMALFSFHILYKKLNKSIFVAASSSVELHKQLPPRSRWSWLTSPSTRSYSSMPCYSLKRYQAANSETPLRIQPSPAKYLSHCEHERVTPWSEVCRHSLRYLPHEMSWKVNKHIQMERKNRRKQELFNIRSVFMLSL